MGCRLLDARAGYASPCGGWGLLSAPSLGCLAFLASPPHPLLPPLHHFPSAAVKILRGHEMVDFQGCLDVAFHPTQPWAFTAGADATINLYVNP